MVEKSLADRPTRPHHVPGGLGSAGVKESPPHGDALSGSRDPRAAERGAGGYAVSLFWFGFWWVP